MLELGAGKALLGSVLAELSDVPVVAVERGRDTNFDGGGGTDGRGAAAATTMTTTLPRLAADAAA